MFQNDSNICQFVILCKEAIHFFKKILSSGHLKIELNNFLSFDFFSIFQFALVTKTHYALVVQILEQLKKISDLMHLYFQSGFFASFFLHFFIKKNLNNFFSSVL